MTCQNGGRSEGNRIGIRRFPNADYISDMGILLVYPEIEIFKKMVKHKHNNNTQKISLRLYRKKGILKIWSFVMYEYGKFIVNEEFQ